MAFVSHRWQGQVACLPVRSHSPVHTSPEGKFCGTSQGVISHLCCPKHIRPICLLKGLSVCCTESAIYVLGSNYFTPVLLPTICFWVTVQLKHSLLQFIINIPRSQSYCVYMGSLTCSQVWSAGQDPGVAHPGLRALSAFLCPDLLGD